MEELLASLFSYVAENFTEPYTKAKTLASDWKTIYMFVILTGVISKHRMQQATHLQKTIDDEDWLEKELIRKSVKEQFGRIKSIMYNAMHDWVFYSPGGHNRDIVIIKEIETNKRTAIGFLTKFHRGIDTYLFKNLLDDFVFDALLEDIGNGALSSADISNRAVDLRKCIIDEVEKNAGKNKETEEVLANSLTFEVVRSMYSNIVSKALLIKKKKYRAISNVKHPKRVSKGPLKKLLETK